MQQYGALDSAVAPTQQNMGGEIFSGTNEVLIKQEFKAIEVLGFEAKNHYSVSAGQNSLYITEKSDDCERCFCGPNRSLTLMLHGGDKKDDPVIMSMHKPFTCFGCCIMRPSFEVYGPGGKTDLIGRIEDPCRCCVMDQQVMSATGDLLFTTNGSMLQLGICCVCCGDVRFDVEKQGQAVAEIRKPALTGGEVMGKTNRFSLHFDQITDPTERKLMFASAMLLDLTYFEQK